MVRRLQSERKANARRTQAWRFFLCVSFPRSVPAASRYCAAGYSAVGSQTGRQGNPSLGAEVMLVFRGIIQCPLPACNGRLYANDKASR